MLNEFKDIYMIFGDVLFVLFLKIIIICKKSLKKEGKSINQIDNKLKLW